MSVPIGAPIGIVELHTDARSLRLLLAEALRRLHSHETAMARACIQQAEKILVDKVEALPPATCKGGLSTWQSRRLKSHIDENLGQCLSLCEAASESGLSASHFARAFRATFGRPFHRYIIEKRIERARILMVETDLPLCEIAIECGLSDQAHLTRLFKRATGATPNAWRRRQRLARSSLPPGSGPVT